MTANEDRRRIERFRRALRWYPASWRIEHGEVLLGILLDEADDTRRSGPGAGQRFALLVGGLRHHLRAGPGRTPATILPLALVTAFFAFYVAVNWSPGVVFPGAVGPFTNPSVFAGMGFAAALGLAVAGRTGAARGIALLASAAELGIALLAATQGWLGPSLATAAPVAALGLLTIMPWRGRATAVISILVLIGLPLQLIAIDLIGATLLSSFPSMRFGLQLPVVGGVLIAIGLAARRATHLEERMIGGPVT